MSECGFCEKALVLSTEPYDLPDAKHGESPKQTEARKWIAWLLRRRPRALSRQEEEVLGMFYGLNGHTRGSCAMISRWLGSAAHEAHQIAATALQKICYDKPNDHGQAAKTLRLRELRGKPRSFPRDQEPLSAAD